MTDNPCGEKIKKRRDELGWSLRHTAVLAGISDGRLRQIEKGYTSAGAGVRVTTRPSQRLLRSLARVLDLDGDELVQMAESHGRSTEPDVKDVAHQAFVALIRADDTLDDISKNHIINQHAILQRASSLPPGEGTSEEVKRIGKQQLAGARAVKRTVRKRQTPGAE